MDTGGYAYTLGSMRFEDGYLIKAVAMRSVPPLQGSPSLEELQRFNQAPNFLHSLLVLCFINDMSPFVAPGGAGRQGGCRGQRWG